MYESGVPDNWKVETSQPAEQIVDATSNSSHSMSLVWLANKLTRASTWEWLLVQKKRSGCSLERR